MNQKYRTILLEDDMVSRMILENYCKNHPSIDFQKDFEDVEDAIHYMKNNKVDLMFLDIHLKSSYGFDIVKHLSASTQVIITTSDPANCEIALSYNITNCLLKPITLESFLWSIRNLKDPEP